LTSITLTTDYIATPDIQIRTPPINNGVRVNPRINRLNIVERIALTLLVIEVVRAEVAIVHYNWANTSKLAERQNISNMVQKSILWMLGFCSKVRKEPLTIASTKVMGTMMNDCY